VVLRFFYLGVPSLPVRNSAPQLQYPPTQDYHYYLQEKNSTNMPLVIKELHIKITINQPSQAQQAIPVSVANEGTAGAANAIASRNEGEKDPERGDDNNNRTV